MYRVSNFSFFRHSTQSLLRYNADIMQLNNQISSGKRVSLPSDDPVDSSINSNTHDMLEQLQQYDDNLENAQSWLSMSESVMSSMNERLIRLQTMAEQMSTGTYSGEERKAVSVEAQNILSDLISMVNTRLGGDYIFAGTAYNQLAASQELRCDNPSLAGEGNAATTTGLLYGSGSYTGDLSRKITLTVAAVDAGNYDQPTQINYSYVDDYGRTISGKANLQDFGQNYAVDVGDGVKIYAQKGRYSVGDTFTLEVGRQQGNDEALDANLSWANRLRFNYTFSELFGAEGQTGGDWTNFLDKLAEWARDLENDAELQDFFVGMTSTVNNPSTTGQIEVSGDYDLLKSRQIEFHVGGLFHAVGDDATVAARQYNFTVDPAYTGGVPSADNPMTVNYTYLDGGVPASGTVVLTGTGADNLVSLDPPLPADQVVSLWVGQDDFQAGDQFSFLSTVGGPAFTDQTTAYLDQTGFAFTVDPSYAGGAPSATNPLTLNYSWTDGTGALHNDTVTVTNPGDPPVLLADGVTSLWLEDKDYTAGEEFGFLPEAGGDLHSWTDRSLLETRRYEISVAAVDASGFPTAVNYTYLDDAVPPNLVAGGPVAVTGSGPGNAFQVGPVGENTYLYLDAGTYTVGQSLNLLSAHPDDTAASSENPLRVTYTWRDDMNVRHSGEMTFTGDGADNGFTLWGLPEGEEVGVALSEGGTFDQFDNFDLTLEQYGKGQETSQNILDRLDSAMANLLKYEADAGSRLNRLEMRQSLFQEDNLRLYGRLQRLEDIDATDAISQLKLQETLYQAALQATAMISSRSLADYV
ncbi:MAG: hypothetical protein KQJ78_00350 [Deltaproteobacteria bacterium]|nr:hypothetical protein [Deltaproteobacteria bacterium]